MFEIILTFSCADQPGIVAAVASHFAERGFNIKESSQFEDEQSGQFFMRTKLGAPATGKVEGSQLEAIKAAFAPIASQYQMDWQIHDANQPMKVVIAVSKWGHCLNKLLNNYKRGSLPIEVVAVVSNHPDMAEVCEWYQVPYHHLAVNNQNREQQEQQILEIMQQTDAELLVLARYMQILSDDMCQALPGKIINIHHSFLPGFKGAKPYHQAHERGVKLIGATAHYVTSDLDEGPIIEQAVERVSHANTVDELVEIGRDSESVVLQRAVRWHAEHRVILNGQKTIVFSR